MEWSYARARSIGAEHVAHLLDVTRRCDTNAPCCPKSRALSSVVERLLHTQEVTGSNPVARTIQVPGASKGTLSEHVDFREHFLRAPEVGI